MTLCFIVCYHFIEYTIFENVQKMGLCFCCLLTFLKYLSFFFHIILPGVKAELKYARPLHLFKFNDTYIVCLLFYTILTVENLRGSSVLHPWFLNISKYQSKCCTLQPLHYSVRNEDWTVALYHQMRPEEQSILLNIYLEQPAAMTWKKTIPFDLLRDISSMDRHSDLYSYLYDLGYYL